jgi:hypothetical protein
MVSRADRARSESNVVLYSEARRARGFVSMIQRLFGYRGQARGYVEGTIL